MATLQIARGTAKDFDRQRLDRNGNAYTSANTPFLSTDTLATTLWAGDDTVSLATPATAWIDADVAAWRVSFAASDTSSLSAATYDFRTTATRGGKTVEVERGRLEVLWTAGTATQPLAFTTYEDLLKYLPWVGSLQAETDRAGFAEQQARATNWLVDLLVDLYKYQNYGPTIGQPGYGPSTMFGGVGPWPPNKWFRDQITPVAVDGSHPANSGNANVSTCLIIREKTKEICAKMAISYVLEAQMGRNTNRDWWALARNFQRDAESLLGTYQAEIDLSTPPTGYASITVHCGSTNVR